MPGLACVIAALGDRLSHDILKTAMAYFEDYLKPVSTRSGDLKAQDLWSAARVLACLGRKLSGGIREAALDRIVQTVVQKAPGAGGFELVGLVSAATMVAWERQAGAKLNGDDLKARPRP